MIPRGFLNTAKEEHHISNLKDEWMNDDVTHACRDDKYAFV
jgi:hypothetical protein